MQSNQINNKNKVLNIGLKCISFVIDGEIRGEKNRLSF